MKKILVKILTKLTNFNSFNDFGIVDESKISKWFYISYKDDGWKNYYTLRKRNILALLSLGVDRDEEYWQLVGRMKELKSLSANINLELARRKKKEAKSKKDV